MIGWRTTCISGQIVPHFKALCLFYLEFSIFILFFFLPLRSGIRGNYFYRREYSVITLHRRSSGVVSMNCACMETVSSYVMTESVFQAFVNLGPVVQSIVSLKSSLRTQLVKCFATL